jgi:hypothetical protein
MRLHRGVRTVAAVLAAGAVAAAPAQAKFDNTTYPPLGQLHPTVHHSKRGPSEPPLAVGGLAAAALLGGGVAVSRRTARPADVRVISGS